MGLWPKLSVLKDKIRICTVANRSISNHALVLKTVRSYPLTLDGAADASGHIATSIRNGMGAQIGPMSKRLRAAHNTQATIGEILDITRKLHRNLGLPTPALMEWFRFTEVLDRWGLATVRGRSKNWLRSASTFLTRLDVANIASQVGDPELAGHFVTSLGDLEDLAPKAKWGGGDLTDVDILI